jgi:hypothetical protein
VAPLTTVITLAEVAASSPTASAGVVRTVSLVALLAIVVAGTMAIVVVGHALLRIAVAALVIAAALWVWDQRASIGDCITRLQHPPATAGAPAPTGTCHAFGMDLSV